MKLERRFDWNDLKSVYRQIDEERDVEQGSKGMVRFTCVRIDETKFSGQGYESTVAAMVDTRTGFFKLASNPRNPEKAIVVEASPPLPQSEEPSENPSGTETPRTAKRK